MIYHDEFKEEIGLQAGTYKEKIKDFFLPDCVALLCLVYGMLNLEPVGTAKKYLLNTYYL